MDKSLYKFCLNIISKKVPAIQSTLAEQICRFMELLRKQDFYKRPCIAETIDWAKALISLGIDELDQETIDDTLCCILKYKNDQEKISVDKMQKLIALTKNIKGGPAIKGQGSLN